MTNNTLTAHFNENKADEREFKKRLDRIQAQNAGWFYGDIACPRYDSGSNIPKLPIMDDYQDLRRPSNAPRYNNAA